MVECDNLHGMIYFHSGDEGSKSRRKGTRSLAAESIGSRSS